MGPKRLSILGVGLLGGSLGLAVRRLLKDCEIVGYGHRAATLEVAVAIGAIQQARRSAAEAVRGADLVVLCTPVGLFQEMLREIAPALSPGAIVTDVGSTKRSVVAAAEKALPAGIAFVGSHPMAGSEKRGVEFATANLFQDAVCITTPTEQTDRQGLERVEDFWRLLGMHLIRLSPEEHDRRLASVSHLPHAVAAALMTVQDNASLPLAGKGFRDSTRIAAGDAGLWRDIFIDNRDHLRASLRTLRGQLERLESLLEAGDADAVKIWLDSAAARRRALPRLDDPGV
jgi:prephenate dehydrogenase